MDEFIGEVKAVGWVDGNGGTATCGVRPAGEHKPQLIVVWMVGFAKDRGDWGDHFGIAWGLVISGMATV